MPTISDPTEVWLQAVAQDGRVRYMPLYIRVDGSTVAVAEEHRDGTLAWTLYPAGAGQIDRKRVGYLLYWKP